MFLRLPVQVASSAPPRSWGPVLSEPAESLRGLPNSFSHTSIDEGTIRLVWGFCYKNMAAINILVPLSLHPLCFLGTMTGSWANHFPSLSLDFPSASGRNACVLLDSEVTPPRPHFPLWRGRRCFSSQTQGLRGQNPPVLLGSLPQPGLFAVCPHPV